MKTFIVIIIFLLNVLQAFSQSEDTIYLKGHANYHITQEQISKKDTLIFFESRVAMDRKVCSLYSDSSYSRYYVFLEQEVIKNDSISLELLDYILIKELPINGTIVIGSNEYSIKKDENDNSLGFVVSVECCYEIKDEYSFYKSKKIIELWSNGNGNKKLEKMNPDYFVRYNEGFYKKN